MELQRSIADNFGSRPDSVRTYAEAREYLDNSSRNISLAILDLNLSDAQHFDIVDLFCSSAVPCILFTPELTVEAHTRLFSKEIIDHVVKDSHAVENLLCYIRRLRRNRKIKILVAGGSMSFRYSLCAMLHRQMFQVLDVEDGESALSILDSGDPVGLVIADYEMPGMNGVDLTWAIRARYSKEQMPVIGISSSDPPMLTARFIQSGANDFISKPFQIEELYCRVDNNVEMVDTIRRLRQANKFKNQFLGMAAHDLRSPINGINGLAEMFLGGLCGELTEEQREVIEFIHSANLHMNDMVNDLLDISVIEAGRLQLVKKFADLGSVIKERLRIHALTAKAKGITLVFPEGRFAPCLFDARRIGQVLDNLLTNAIKFSFSNRSINITLEESGGKALVSVIDHGQGIPSDEKDLLFQIQTFRKTSIRPTAGEASTGLGLAIVKKIVEAHGGEVWVESKFGHGATFRFTLPMN